MYFVSSLQGQDEVSIKENKTKKDNDKGKKINKNEDIQDPSHKESSKQVLCLTKKFKHFKFHIISN